MLICKPCDSLMIEMGVIDTYLQDGYWVKGMQMQCVKCRNLIINTDGLSLRHLPDKKYNSNIHGNYEQTTTPE